MRTLSPPMARRIPATTRLVALQLAGGLAPCARHQPIHRLQERHVLGLRWRVYTTHCTNVVMGGGAVILRVVRVGELAALIICCDDLLQGAVAAPPGGWAPVTSRGQAPSPPAHAHAHGQTHTHTVKHTHGHALEYVAPILAALVPHCRAIHPQPIPRQSPAPPLARPHLS